MRFTALIRCFVGVFYLLIYFLIPRPLLAQGPQLPITTDGVDFTGQVRISSGIIHLYTRNYNPETGRFLQRDLFRGWLQYPQSQNPFYYTNTPNNAIDPRGMASLALPGGLTGTSHIGLGKLSIGVGVGPLVVATGAWLGGPLARPVADDSTILAALSAVQSPAGPPLTIVELGAGNYRNAMLMKTLLPHARVIATNDPDEWELAQEYVNLVPEEYRLPELAHATDMALNALLANAMGIEVFGPDGRPLSDDDIPCAIGDLVYSVAPYPMRASQVGANAARIAKPHSGTLIGVTSGDYGGRFFRDGLLNQRPDLNGQRFVGAPFGPPNPIYSGSNQPETWLFIQP